MKVLIVDDDDDIAAMLKTFCESLDIEVEVAYSGSEGIYKLGRNIPNLVLLDVSMPKMDGLEALIEMQKISQKPQYMMMTAYKDAAKIIEAYRQGAVDCLLKPIDFEYLKGRINDLKALLGHTK